MDSKQRTTTAVLASDGSGVTLLDGEFCYAGGVGVLVDAAAAERFLVDLGWVVTSSWVPTHDCGRPAAALVAAGGPA